MYFKVLLNNKIIDILKNIEYIRYQKKYNRNILCDIQNAEAILSSDRKKGYHIYGLYNYPLDKKTYEVIEITLEEYNRLANELNIESFVEE